MMGIKSPQIRPRKGERKMPSYLSYKRQIAVLDENNDDITWITVKGNHIPIKKGQNKGEAVKEFFEKKNAGSKSEKVSKKPEKETRMSLALKIAALEKPTKISEKEYAKRLVNGVGAVKGSSLAELQKLYERRKSESGNKVEKKLAENAGDVIKSIVPEKYRDTLTKVLESVAKNKADSSINEESVVKNAIKTYEGKFSEKEITNRMNVFNKYLDSGKKKGEDGEMHQFDTMWKYKKGGKWVDGEYVGGEWSPERQKIQNDILKADFADWENKLPAKGEKPKLVILGGRGGSGKSFFTNGKLGKDGYDKSKFLVVDPDEYKTKLPEYKKFVDDNDERAGVNAWEVHEESSDMKKQALAMAKSLGINVVLDGTLAKTKSVEKTIKEFLDAGYDVDGSYMQLNRDQSAMRGLARAMHKNEKGVSTGRLVPLKNLLGMVDNEENFVKLIPYFTKWQMYDNNVKMGEAPKLVAKSE